MLLCSAARRPDLVQAALQQAIALRETIYRIFSAVADRRGPTTEDLDRLNPALCQALSHRKVVLTEHGFAWAWAGDPSELEGIVWPILDSCAELLTSTRLGQLRQCAREGCDWLFLDFGKNQSRRWCSMDLCGSRVKASRHYRRKKREGRD